MTSLTTNQDEVTGNEANNITNNDKVTSNAPSWLDNEFVETIMRRDDSNPQLAVVNIDVKSAVPKGDNYVSLLLRVDVEYRDRPGDDETMKRSLIVKSFPDGEIIQKWVEKSGIFGREAMMYDVTLPAMYRVLGERTGVEHEPLGTRVYVCDRPNTIVLEDLRPLGYKMADRRQGLDLKHSVMALRTLAKLHALSIALHAEDPTCMDDYYENMYNEENRKDHTDIMVPTFDKLAVEVGSWPGCERFEEKLKKVSGDVVNRLLEIVKNKPGSPRVLNHGDFWTNNMLFRYDAEGDIDDVKMLDFQMARFASPALDIIYFLHTSCRQQVLEDHWDEMLEEYHAALCDTMRLVNCDDHLFISMDQLKQEMEDKAFFAFLMSGMFALMVADPEDAPDFSTITEEDIESGNVENMNKTFCGKRFKEVFQRRLPMFERKGLI